MTPDTDKLVYEEPGHRKTHLRQEFVSQLFVGLRSGHLALPSDSLDKHAEVLRDLVRQIHNTEGSLSLTFVDGALLLNDTRLRLDRSCEQRRDFIVEQMLARGAHHISFELGVRADRQIPCLPLSDGRPAINVTRIVR